MNLKELVAELNNNTFTASQITSLECFLSLHEGKTLFELMAEKDNALDLMNGAMLQFSKLAFDQAELKDAADAFNPFSAYLYQMCHTLVQRGSKEVVQQAAHSPSTYFTFLNRPTRGYLSQFVEYFQVQSLITQFIRSQYLNKMLAELTRNCGTVADLKNIKAGLTDLAGVGIFAAHRTYLGWALQGLSQAARTVSTYVPEYTTGSVAFMTGACAGLSSIDALHFEGLTPEEKTCRIKLFAHLYRAVQPGLQINIVSHLEALIQAQQNNPEHLKLISDVLFNIPPKYRFTKPALLSQLSPASNLLLLKHHAPEFYTQDSTEYYEQVVTALTTTTTPIKFIFEFLPATTQVEELLARVFAAGNFPGVAALHIPIDNTKFTPITYGPLLFSNKLIFIDDSDHQDPSLLARYPFFIPLSVEGQQYYIDTSTMISANKDASSFKDNAQAFIQYALEHGVKNIHLCTHDLREHSTMKFSLSYTRGLTPIPKDCWVYHKFSFNRGQVMDVVIDEKGARPGPITEQSVGLTLVFNGLNMGNTSTSAAPTSSPSLTLANFTGASSSNQVQPIDVIDKEENQIIKNNSATLN